MINVAEQTFMARLCVPINDILRWNVRVMNKCLISTLVHSIYWLVHAVKTQNINL